MIQQKRRKKLLSKLDKNALAIICTNSEVRRNNDVCFPFRPDSNFWYLTGFNEPDAIAVFTQNNYVIFLQEKDKNKELWEGKRLGVDNAKTTLMADDAYPIKDFFKQIKKFIKKDTLIYYDNTTSNKFANKIAAKYPQSKTITPYIAEMRLIKEKIEIEKMQEAAKISMKAHKKAMQKVKPGMFEYQVMALFDFEFSSNNTQHAYNPIVATGENACTLHYTENNKALGDNELLLIDAGCEFEYYAADITRTFPVNGKFSKEQKQIYSIVLKAQKAAINKLMPDMTITQAHQVASEVIENELVKLGIIKDDLELSEFYMHGTSHWLGLDVHDCGQYKINNKPRKLKPGMVMTVEPGIYIRKNDKIDDKYWNIGIRIEDNVLITDSGNKVLTKALVKEIADIEKLMAK